MEFAKAVPNFANLLYFFSKTLLNQAIGLEEKEDFRQIFDCDRLHFCLELSGCMSFLLILRFASAHP